MKNKQCKTHWCRIYISGPMEIAKQVLREECLREGLCVTIDPTLYIYTGGEEAGYVVNLVNYPRFPVAEEAIVKRARHIAKLLLKKTHQHSVMLMTPTTTEWTTLRKDN